MSCIYKTYTLQGSIPKTVECYPRVISNGGFPGILGSCCYSYHSLHGYLEYNTHESYLAQYQCGILPLEIETGRWQNKPVEERICKVCESGEVEN